MGNPLLLIVNQVGLLVQYRSGRLHFVIVKVIQHSLDIKCAVNLLLGAEVALHRIKLSHAITKVLLSRCLTEAVLPYLIIAHLALGLHERRYILTVQVGKIVVTEVD